MPRFEITGADRDTGNEHTFVLNAKNEGDARATAALKHLMFFNSATYGFG